MTTMISTSLAPVSRPAPTRLFCALRQVGLDLRRGADMCELATLRWDATHSQATYAEQRKERRPAGSSPSRRRTS
jgi:hypothetical protein